MKVTKELLREMIIQEYTREIEFTNDNRLGVDDGGEEMMRSDFQSTSFEDDIKRITGLLDDMETIVREDKLLKPQDLEYFKNNHLDNLMRKIGFLEGAIDARLSGKFDEAE